MRVDYEIKAAWLACSLIQALLVLQGSGQDLVLQKYKVNTDHKQHFAIHIDRLAILVSLTFISTL